jgi:hypothetical protein
MKRQEQSDWDDITPPTQEEWEQARRLRDALENHEDHPDEQLYQAIRLVHEPPQLEPRVNDWLVKKAIHKARPKAASKLIAFVGIGAAFAAAAGLFITLSNGDWASITGQPPPVVKASLIPSRSTHSLFQEPFERHGGTTHRVDTISSSRDKYHRWNRFTSMGVRP